MPKRSVVIHITGKVQGVFYRQSAAEKASELGVSGTVRNLGDGSVEAMASGDDASLEEFIRWCWEGPPAAQVENIEVRNVEPLDVKGFAVIR